MRIGINNPQDFLGLLVRRKWWIVVPFLALSFAVALITYFLPEIFVSETLILVRNRDVPTDFVVDLIESNTEQRLKSIEQTVLSRTNLVQILREFEYSLPEYRRFNMDQRVARLRSEININFDLDSSRALLRQQPTLSYFRISYQNRNPELAQKIANKLTSLFIEQDNRARETQVYGTTEFLSAELDKVSQLLDASEDQLKGVKSAHQFELPDQLETNLRSLDRLIAQKQTNAEALDRYASIRLNLESQISQTPKEIPPPPAPGARTPSAAAPADPLLEEYRRAELEYTQAAAKYTDKHPEVQSAKIRAERLKEQLPPEKQAAESGGESAQALVPNPLYQTLTGQLRDAKTEFEIREREKAFIEAELEKYSRRLENTPQSEQRIADVLRQNTDLKKQYEDLKAKLDQARLAESLESKQKGSQFVIVDPANFPLAPSKPNKQMLMLSGSMASLVFAVALAVLIDVGRQRVRTQSEVEAFWGVPVLVDIPEILIDADLAEIRRKKRIWALSSLAGALAYGFCMYVVYLKHNFILQQLEPLIQRFVYR